MHEPFKIGPNSPPRRRKLRRMGLVLAAAVTLSEGRVEAASNLELASSQVVVVSPPRCDDDSFPLVAFLDSLRVELAGRGLECCTLSEPGDGTSADTSLHVNVEELGPCGAEPERVRIIVQRRDGSQALEREISLTDVSQAARPRALALAVAELIRSLGQEVRQEPAQPAPSAPQRPKPTPKAPEAMRGAPVAYSMHIEAEVRHFPSRDTTLWGGRARLTAYRRAVHTDVDLGANFSRVQTDLGELLVRSASVGFGLGPRLPLPSAIIDLGPHAEIGWAWIRGSTTLANVGTASGSALIANVGLRASLEADAKMRPCLTLETGAVLRGMNGSVSGQTVSGIEGYYVLAALGMAVSL